MASAPPPPHPPTTKPDLNFEAWGSPEHLYDHSAIVKAQRPILSTGWSLVPGPNPGCISASPVPASPSPESPVVSHPFLILSPSGLGGTDPTCSSRGGAVTHQHPLSCPQPVTSSETGTPVATGLLSKPSNGALAPGLLLGLSGEKNFSHCSFWS